MGKFNSSSDSVIQEWATNPASHSFSTPAFWNNSLYYFGVIFNGDVQRADLYLQHVERDVQHDGCIVNSNGIWIFGGIAVDLGVVGHSKRNRVGDRHWKIRYERQRFGCCWARNFARL